jgi:replicative DNA helicase
MTIEEVMRRPTYKRGVPTIGTGFESLDGLLSGGFRCGFSSIIASRTGNAKSQLAANIVRRAALDGTPTLFIGLEEPLPITVFRIHAAGANVPTTVLLNGIESADLLDVNALRGAYSTLTGLPLRLADQRDITTIRRLIELHAESGGRLVVLDQASKITTPHLPRNAGIYERVSEISEQLRDVAGDTGVAVVLVVQVNREASKRAGDLELHDLRDSGMLEQDAAVVLLLNKAKMPPTATSAQVPGPCRLLPVHLGKQRFGRAGDTIEMLWYPALARIDDPLRVDSPGGVG